MRLAALVLASSLTATAAVAQDADRSVAGGGIAVDGWNGRIDRRPLSQGKTVNDSKFAAAPYGFRLSVGPAGIFWSNDGVASGIVSCGNCSFKTGEACNVMLWDKEASHLVTVLQNDKYDKLDKLIGST